MDKLALDMVDQMSAPVGTELLPEPPKDLQMPSFELGKVPPPLKLPPINPIDSVPKLPNTPIEKSSPLPPGPPSKNISKPVEPLKLKEVQSISKKKSKKRKKEKDSETSSSSERCKYRDRDIIPMYVGQPCYTEYNYSPFMYAPFTNIPNPKEDIFAAREIDNNPFTTFSPLVNPMSMPPFMPSELGQPFCGVESSQHLKHSFNFSDFPKHFPGLNPMSGTCPEPIINEMPGTSDNVHFMVDDIEWEVLQSKYHEADIADAIYKEYTRRLERLKDFHFKPTIKKQLRSLQQVMNALHLHAKYSERSKREILQHLVPKKKKKPKHKMENDDDDDEIQLLKDRLNKLREKFNRSKKFDHVFPRQNENERLVMKTFSDGMREIFTTMTIKCKQKAEKDMKEQKENELNLELLKQLEMIKLQNPTAKEVVIEKNPTTGKREIIVKN
ncbi:hypothetical protein HELRODRAFT_181807 [Helobdella robusta]|uniref:Uncharacterized protein n=1 Tax=Helobdella robusta TaxID=6412 RepID=T1FHC7_HELRO|nr:hypothetical protein HELRODRAFT_181807 [Helobdella robusta]ESN92031.1 hypothetical protein HELRODRAFT_181807 [Helobdella robusta]